MARACGETGFPALAARLSVLQTKAAEICTRVFDGP
jgi:hypothetical protein